MCEIAPGLSDREFTTIEAEFDIEFAEDHRSFLAAGLPTNNRPEPRDPNASYAWEHPWPDWRDGDRDELRRQLDWPVEGVLFDVEHGQWLQECGSRPTTVAGALAIARARLAKVPKLIPIYAHRYLPAGHAGFNHPVLSVWQTDIIYYGHNLHDYISQEIRPATPRRNLELEGYCRLLEPIPGVIPMTAGKPMIAILTGAGISTDSGVPDFRGPKSSE